jgi:hypothetical protein
MGVSFSEVGYTSATTGREVHEVHQGHAVAMEENIYIYNRNCFGTQWQQYSTHLHTNTAQNTENGTHITIKKIKNTQQ